jgi:hypothetical protein
VRTLRHAATLLSAADSVDTLLPIAGEMGLEPLALPLDDELRAGLGLTTEVSEARIVRSVRC